MFTINELVLLIIGGVSIFSSFVAIGLLYYIGYSRIKKIDKVVYGHEFENDSIFGLLIRVPNYAGAFMWKWSAKRSGLEDKIEHFDNRFKWPFIASFVLFAISILCLILGVAYKNYVGL